MDIRLDSSAERILWAVCKAEGFLKIPAPKIVQDWGLGWRSYQKQAEAPENNGFVLDETYRVYGGRSSRYRALRLTGQGKDYCELHKDRLEKSFG